MYCVFDKCNKQPTYSLKGTKNAEYCAKHKLLNYVDVKSKNVYMIIAKKELLTIFQVFLLNNVKFIQKKKNDLQTIIKRKRTRYTM